MEKHAPNIRGKLNTFSFFYIKNHLRYGEYLNYGPLDTDKYDFHVTVGAVSTLNGTTKGNNTGKHSKDE